jgi:signal transduction histidine kinase
VTTPGQRREAASLFILAISVAGAALVLAGLPAMVRWDASATMAWAVLTAAITVLELFPIHIRYRTETINMSLTDGVWAAGLLLVSPDVLVMSVGAGAVLSQLIRRRPPRKIAFNAGQYLVSISAALFVFSGLGGDPGPVTGLSWLPVVPAMAAFLIVNATSVALVVGLTEGRGVATILRRPFVPNLLHFACNTAIGVLAAILWSTEPAAVLLLLAPVSLSYFAYRSLANLALERDRMRDLYEAGRTLLGPIESSADFYPFLGLVQRMLDATLVEVVVAEENELVVHDSAGHTSRRGAEPDGGGRISLGSYLGAAVDSRRDESAQVKVVAGREGARGLLVIHRAAPMTDAEHAVLDALASQLTVMLENHRLFVETLDQARLVDIISDSSDGVFVVSPDERILSWNPAMEDMSNVPAADAIGRPVLELLSVGDPVGGEVVSLHPVPELPRGVPRGADAGPALPSETGDAMILGRELGRRWVRYTKNVIRDRDGGVKAHVVVARDVSAEMEAEQAKAEFVATISHELRTPLTPLKGFLLTLLQGTVAISPRERDEYYRIMFDQVTRLERLIGDLLEASRLETAGASVEIRHIELGAVVRQQIREFAQCQPTRPIQMRGPRRNVNVQADPIRVAQVVANLLSNAMKYSPADSPIVVTLSSDEDEALIAVRDQGEGVPADKQDRIFDRFYRIETGLTRRTSGTGLGLYITKRLVDAMGGRIWVDSPPTGGSTFFVTLQRAHRALASIPPASVNGLPA